MKNISFLFGAGFSAPQGYPIGNQLNNLILKSNNGSFVFSPNGELVTNINGDKPNLGYKNSYDNAFDFCYKLIKHFEKEKGYFDYEEFFDYLVDEIETDKSIKHIIADFKSKRHNINILKNDSKIVYTKVVAHYLKDKEGISYYDNLPYINDSYAGYTGIMKVIKELSKDYILHIHTLNHDLFFERFNNSSFLENKLSNGFEELGSEYYGELTDKNRTYKVRLERYTGNYFGRLRFYKLHGSLDYLLYYKEDNVNLIPDKYVKIKYGIGYDLLYKEIKNSSGKLEYENCFINYHPDFLTGTTSKIERYKEPLLFKRLFELFKSNLQNSEKLVIIGYGAKDKEINKIILDKFDYKNKQVFIIDPYAGEKVKEFSKMTNAKLITTQLENIEISDLK